MWEAPSVAARPASPDESNRQVTPTATLPPPLVWYQPSARVLPPPKPRLTIVSSTPTADPDDTSESAANASTPIAPAVASPAVAATTPRRELNGEFQGLLERANEKLQLERAERRELDAWVVSVVNRLVDVEDRRQALEDRTETLEARLADVERTGGPAAQQALWRAQLLDDRLTAVERRQAQRRAFSWWPHNADRSAPSH